MLERATLCVFAKLHQLVVVEQREFIVLWICNNRDTPSPLPLSWWRQTYWSVPYIYHERLQTLCVVHPSIAVRAKLFLLSYLPRHSFWEKLDYADRLEFLDAHVPLAVVKSLPQEVKEHDKDLDREMYAPVQSGAPGSESSYANGGLWTAGGLSRAAGFGDSSNLAPNGEGEENPARPVELPKRNWED